MAVRIRLMRGGRKKLPFYRIVVADSKAPRDGRYIEVIGRYDPLPATAEVTVDEGRLFKWLDDGAAMSDTVKNLMRHKGLTLKYELIKRNADEATVNKELQKWEMARQERENRAAEAKTKKAAPAEAKAEPAPEPEPEPVAEVKTEAKEEVEKEAEVAEEKAEEAAAPEVVAEEPAETEVAPETPAKEPEQGAEAESKDEK